MNITPVKFVTLSTFLVGVAMLSGCASVRKDADAGKSDMAVMVKTAELDRGIDVAQRALPTITDSVKQPAHYQHVYVEPGSKAADSIKTLPLVDAVASNVLASNDRSVRRFELDSDKLRWAVLEKAASRPSQIEGVGGAGVETENLSEVNFDLNETVIINPDRLQKLIRKARMVSGLFYVVGYADESGIESKNLTLSKERAESVAAFLSLNGVHSTRIKSNGAGISRIYSGLDRNRRASVSFLIEE